MKKCFKCGKIYNDLHIKCECCGRKLIDMNEVEKLMKPYSNELKKEAGLFSCFAIVFGGIGIGVVAGTQLFRRSEEKKRIEEMLDRDLNKIDDLEWMNDPYVIELNKPENMTNEDRLDSHHGIYWKVPNRETGAVEWKLNKDVKSKFKYGLNIDKFGRKFMF